MECCCKEPMESAEYVFIDVEGCFLSSVKDDDVVYVQKGQRNMLENIEANECTLKYGSDKSQSLNSNVGGKITTETLIHDQDTLCNAQERSTLTFVKHVPNSINTIENNCTHGG